MSCGPQMPAMPLSMVKAGETVRVSRVKGNEDMKHHLKDLGFVEGNEIHVVSSSGANIIVTVLGARFGIDSKVAIEWRILRSMSRWRVTPTAARPRFST